MPLVFMAVWASASALLALAVGRMMGHIRVREAAVVRVKSARKN
jgi:hypothetical protein